MNSSTSGLVGKLLYELYLKLMNIHIVQFNMNSVIPIIIMYLSSRYSEYIASDVAGHMSCDSHNYLLEINQKQKYVKLSIFFKYQLNFVFQKHENYWDKYKCSFEPQNHSIAVKVSAQFFLSGNLTN